MPMLQCGNRKMTGDVDVDAIHPDLNLAELLTQLWGSTATHRDHHRAKALELATASGAAHDAEVLRNRRQHEERDRG